MRIVIETDGHANGTRISFNGEEQKNIQELRLSVRAGKAVKMQLATADDKGNPDFRSLFCHDFRKYDEVKPGKKEN